MTRHSAPPPAMAPCGRPRKAQPGACQILTPGGRPCRRHHPGGDGEHLWTPALIVQLESLIEDGLTDEQAAARLGFTRAAISGARRTYRIARRADILLTTTDVARLLGCNPKTVGKWTDSGWLEGGRYDRSGGQVRLYSRTQLLRFLEDADHWHRWRPEDIPDTKLREYALKLRGHVRFLTYQQAAQVRCCAPTTVKGWVAKGWLRGYLGYQGTYVREDDLLAMPLPEIGQANRRRSWEPCARCGDADGLAQNGGRSPARIRAARFGFEEPVCLSCYRVLLAREHRARNRQLRAHSAMKQEREAA